MTDTPLYLETARSLGYDPLPRITYRRAGTHNLVVTWEVWPT